MHKNRVLHHGTLLFDSRLDALKGSLKVDLSRFEDKAVQSNRSEVTNIANYLPQPISVEEFTAFIFEEISQNFPDFCVYELTADDVAAIQKLSEEKYQTWDWIFGYWPRYRFSNKLETEDGEIRISLSVVKGRITEADFSGAISPENNLVMKQQIIGCRHEYNEISHALSGLTLFRGSKLSTFLKSMI